MLVLKLPPTDSPVFAPCSSSSSSSSRRHHHHHTPSRCCFHDVVRTFHYPHIPLWIVMTHSVIAGCSKFSLPGTTPAVARFPRGRHGRLHSTWPTCGARDVAGLEGIGSAGQRAWGPHGSAWCGTVGPTVELKWDPQKTDRKKTNFSGREKYARFLIQVDFLSFSPRPWVTRPGFAPSIEKKEGDCVLASRFMRSRNLESLQSSVELVNPNGEPPWTTRFSPSFWDRWWIHGQWTWRQSTRFAWGSHGLEPDCWPTREGHAAVRKMMPTRNICIWTLKGTVSVGCM